MVDAIMLDKKQILPSIALLEGEYGLSGVFVGVPAKLGAKGVEQIVQLKLTDEELAGLKKSGDAVRELNKVMGI